MEKNTKYKKILIAILIIFSPMISESIVYNTRLISFDVLYLFIAMVISSLIGLLLIYKDI